ncbi:rcc01693 family protein [Shimia sp. W99]
MSGFDWPRLMRAAFEGLRMPPEQFWALTPAELTLLLGQGGGLVPMNRSGLDKLLSAYPDQAKGIRDDGN